MPLFNPQEVAAGPYKYKFVSTEIPTGNTVASVLISNVKTTFAVKTEIPSAAFSPGTLVNINIAGIFTTPAIALPLTVAIESGTAILGSVSFTPALNLVDKGWSIDLKCTIHNLQTVDIQGTGVFGGALTPFAIGNNATFAVDMLNNVPISATAKWGALALGGSITMRQIIVTAI